MSVCPLRYSVNTACSYITFLWSIFKNRDLSSIPNTLVGRFNSTADMAEESMQLAAAPGTSHASANNTLNGSSSLSRNTSVSSLGEKQRHELTNLSLNIESDGDFDMGRHTKYRITLNNSPGAYFFFKWQNYQVLIQGRPLFKTGAYYQIEHKNWTQIEHSFWNTNFRTQIWLLYFLYNYINLYYTFYQALIHDRLLFKARLLFK